jgi:copper oxidase (laccase) domain-containing protein
MGVPGADLLAYLGPAIGPQAFEVGAEVRSGVLSRPTRRRQPAGDPPRRNETPDRIPSGRVFPRVGVR